MKIKLHSIQTPLEMVACKSKKIKFESDLKLKLCGKRLYSTESVKYMGVKLMQILVGNIMLMIFPLKGLLENSELCRRDNLMEKSQN